MRVRGEHLRAQSAAPATKSAHRGSQSGTPATKSAVRGPQSAVPATKSALRGSQNAVTATKSSLRGSQVLYLPRNLQFEVSRSDPLHLSRKVDFGVPKHEMSLAPATKSDPRVRKPARHHNESAVATSARCGILRACAVEMQCTVNSSELAAHARALQRSKHQLLFYYRKTPKVCPHCLGKYWLSLSQTLIYQVASVASPYTNHHR